MGRGRSTAAAAVAGATATTGVPAATRSGAKSAQTTERNGKDQVPPPPEESDDSSHDSGVRKTRRSLQPVSKEQNANANIPKQSVNASSIRSRLRKSTQLNHTASLNLVESRVQKNVNFSSSNNSGLGTDELLIVSDGILTRCSVNHEVAASNIQSIMGGATDVVGDDNVMNIVELPDETDNASLDTDTLTPDSSLIPDSNETTCSADDEAESSVFSEDSQTRSSSIIPVPHEDSNSMQTFSVDKQREQHCGGNENNLSNKDLGSTQDDSKIDSFSRRSVTPRPLEAEPPKNAENAPPHETPEHEERLLSSPDFFNLPKPKIIRTYQNKRKLKLEALKKQTVTQEPESNVNKVEAASGVDRSNSDKEPDKYKNEKVAISDQQEVTECRRSQRQRVIKYDVRDLFNMKGSRNQSDSKNSRSSLCSQKPARESPRSDVSSSPQTFKGFSDTDDPSSPMQCTRRPLSRQSNATPTPPPVGVKGNETSSKLDSSEKCSKLNKTPDVNALEGSIIVNDGSHNASCSGKFSENTTDIVTNQRMKTAKVPLKKEPQKPSRILPRRKTVLLNRSAEEGADLLDECIQFKECSGQQPHLSNNVKESEQAKIKSNIFNEHDLQLTSISRSVQSENETASGNIESDKVKQVFAFELDTKEKEIALSSAFKSSSVQCDLGKSDATKSPKNIPKCTISQNSSNASTVPLENEVKTVSIKDQNLSETLEAKSVASSANASLQDVFLMASSGSQPSTDCFIGNLATEDSGENCIEAKITESHEDESKVISLHNERGKSSPVLLEEKSRKQNRRSMKSKSTQLDLRVGSHSTRTENCPSRRTPTLDQGTVNITEAVEPDNLGNFGNEKSRKSTKVQACSRSGNSVASNINNITENYKTIEKNADEDKSNENQFSISSEENSSLKRLEFFEKNACPNSEIHGKPTSTQFENDVDEQREVLSKKVEGLEDFYPSDGGDNLIDRKKPAIKKKQTSKRPKTKAEMKLIEQRTESLVDSETNVVDKITPVIKVENTKRKSKESSKSRQRSELNESRETGLEQTISSLKRSNPTSSSESERSDKSREFVEKHSKKRKLHSSVPGASEDIQVDKTVFERTEIEKIGLYINSKASKTGLTTKSKVTKPELVKHKEKFSSREDVDMFAGKEAALATLDKIKKLKESKRPNIKKECKSSVKPQNNTLDDIVDSTVDAKSSDQGTKQRQSKFLDNKGLINEGSAIIEMDSLESIVTTIAEEVHTETKTISLKGNSADYSLEPKISQNARKEAKDSTSMYCTEISKIQMTALEQSDPSELETTIIEIANAVSNEPNITLTTKGKDDSSENEKNIEHTMEDKRERIDDGKLYAKCRKSHAYLDSCNENKTTNDSNSKAASPSSNNQIIALPENEKKFLDGIETKQNTRQFCQTTVESSVENLSTEFQEVVSKSSNCDEAKKTSNRTLSARGRKKRNDIDTSETLLNDSNVEVKPKSKPSIKSSKTQFRQSIDLDLQKIDEKLAKIQASMMKGCRRKEHSRKDLSKRRLSKSLSTSDGVSDAYSSDSNDSKQPGRINTEDAAKSEKDASSFPKEDPLAQPLNNSLPPATNLSSVLNGLSKVVMNDLLEWTCNNKQTVLQIKDTIDQNQRETSTSKSDIEKREHSHSVLDSTQNEPLKAEILKKMNDNDLISDVRSNEDCAQGEESSQALNQLKELQNIEEKGTNLKPSKNPTVIQTSKEMLAELMSSTLDIDLDNFPDSSEAAEKSELITKSKLSQEIKRLIKSSDGETSVKSSDSEQTDQNSQDSSANIRRSHRIKTQIKSTVGRGLVRDKSDRNQNSASALDLEAQNARFLKDMEERLSQFQMIKENEYKCERIVSKEAKRMTCDCFLTKEEEDRGELGCGEDCLNRLLMIECSSKCTVGERCTNRRFQKFQHARCKVFRTEKKGFGIMADGEIPSGEFIMEYVGEVLNGKQFEKRAAIYSQDKNKHYYFMALRGDSIIDATMKGSISRFINHSCDPNAETQKWTVNGELRIGFFSKRKIYPGEEITFDYQFQRYGKEAQKCYCESANCRGWIGEEPDSEEEEEEVSSSESEDEIEEKSPDAETEKDKRLEPKVTEKGEITPSVAGQVGSTVEMVKDQFAPVDESIGEMAEKKVEKVASIDKPTDKDKFARKALKAAEKFAKIAAKMKARKERERIKQQNRMVMEDPDLEVEIVSLEGSGLINQAHTLKLSRCMVRAKSVLSKLRLLSVLQKGEMACRRLFLDYHGLRLLHGWMSENETVDIEQDLEFRLKTLKTLELLPIPNKTMLKESKVFNVVQSWSTEMEQQISSSEISVDNSDHLSPPLKKQKIDTGTYQEVRIEIKDIADKLTIAWEVLPEVFRIPKRERIEQMKEHEREADRSYKALNLGDEDQYNKQLRNQERFGAKKSYKWGREKYDKRKELAKEADKFNSAEANLTKLQRRQLFAAKVAKDEAEKRLAEERREFEFKCKFYGLDPRYMTPNIMPFCVHPSTGQWYSKEKNKIPTPPSHAHIKVPPKPQSTDPNDYKMPDVDLPPMWKFAMDPRGRLYYYHIKIRIPQWEPPIKILPLTRDSSTGSAALEVGQVNENPPTSSSKMDEPQPGTSKQSLAASSDTSSDSDDTDSDISCSEIIGLKKGVPLKIGKDMIEELKRSRKQKRFSRLVQERTISPRREEDRLYNQIETRRYRENKEKIRRRKEEIKRRKAQLKREAENDQSTSNKDANQSSQPPSPHSPSGKLSIPIQDYLLSSDEDELEKSDYDNSLIEKIVHGDNIVDELDAIAKEKPLKRSLPFAKDHSDLKKRIKVDDKKRIEGNKGDKSKSRKSEAGSNKNASRRAREKFRSDIAGIIVHHLTPYRRDSCHIGRITNNDDFKHLARKLTHFVLIKELKHCDTTGQTLVVTESVKNKSREFIKKYMAKYGEVYIRPANDPEFKDIPH